MKKTPVLFLLLFSVTVYAGEKPAEKPSAPKPFVTSDRITITLTGISDEVYGPWKKDATFRAGEVVFINIELKGLASNERNEVAVQADISVPALGIEKRNIVDTSAPASDAIPMYFRIPLVEVQDPGACAVTITIRDMNAKSEAEFATSFKRSNEIMTFYCSRFTGSTLHSYRKITGKEPGLRKLLGKMKFKSAGEVIIQYTRDDGTTPYVIVPKKMADAYLLVPEDRRETARAGCGASIQGFVGIFLFKYKEMEFYRAVTE
ncbi:MAG: hypothetical protein JXA07_09030 [Spirochaetes bacterium]|nr:hypothetical protein [Spirochaetota bacterium]